MVPDTENLAADCMGKGGELAQRLIILYGGGQGEEQDYTTQHQLSHLHSYYTIDKARGSLSTVYPLVIILNFLFINIKNCN